MNVETYLQRRQKRAEEEPGRRKLCVACRQPDFDCFCDEVLRFDPRIEFVILIHPIEARRRIATGRMSHLCLERSHLLLGTDYTSDERLNAILNDQSKFPVILYPGSNSVNLSEMTEASRNSICPSSRQLVIVVVDGTWATARQMVRLSRNLQGLPRICFTPPAPSNFRVHKQPAPGCYSTVEAIHHTIELLGSSAGFDVGARTHDRLLSVFNRMVERQLPYLPEQHEYPRSKA